jgi:transcription initiation factor TFIID TATA-box-binding protein
MTGSYNWKGVVSESNGGILAFSSGKLLCTGLNDLDAIANMVEEFTEKINLDT